MTKGELIAACLKLMYENDDVSFYAPELDENEEDEDSYEQTTTSNISEDSDYKSKTANIIESINRALSEIAKADKFPFFVKSIDAFFIGQPYTTYNTVPTSNDNDETYIRVLNNIYKWDSDSSAYIKVALPLYFYYTLDNDIFKVLGVNYEINDEYYYQNNDVSVRYNGSRLMLLRRDKGNYIINYTPKYKRLSYSDEDSANITFADSDNTLIPDYILDIVPYFVKGDLYEEDEPQMALLATNKFYQLLEEIVNPYQRQTQTKVDTRYSSI
jgi:hypothetical protein